MELSRAEDADSLFRRAVELGTELLGFDRIGIWLIDPNHPGMIVGTWGTDESGRLRDERGIRLPRNPKYQAQELYDGTVPFVIIREDTAFDDRGRVVGLSDKIIAPLWDGARILGDLVADDLMSQRCLDEDDGEILGILARTVAHLYAHKHIEAALKEALDAKALLLGELRHRTMNSFALMRSLVSIEAARAHDPALVEVLRKLKDRIGVMASLYRQLDVTTGLEEVRLDEYLRKIAVDLLDGYGAETRGVALECSMDPVLIDMKRAVLLGLVVNEILTDALKHAFPEGRAGLISLVLRRDGRSCSFTIADDGIGLPPDFSFQDSHGKGFNLVETLCGQMGAELHVATGKGLRFDISFAA